MKDWLKGMQITLCAFSLLLCANTVHAASFDCAKAHTKVEKLICADPFISRLDGQLGKVYDKDIAKANPEQKKRLITDEIYWLKNMRDWCTTQTCFKHAYWQRLAELETFYMPHSPMYAKASDKAAAIQKILKTAPLYPLGFSNPKKCLDIFHALKEMKGVEFVNPVVQVMSYANPKLVPFRQDVTKRDKKGFPQGAPLTFDYQCSPNLSPPWDRSIGSDGLNECPAYYGLPSFKLFEIPRGKARSHRTQYVFYWDAEYGPMNGGAQGWYSSGTFTTNQLYAAGLKSNFYHVPAPNSGFERNYNSVISYKNEYYIVLIYRLLGSYWMSVYSLKNRNVCLWSPVKTNITNK